MEVPQSFRPYDNALMGLAFIGVLILIAALIIILYVSTKSDYVTEVDVAKVQPIPFSHKHHVQGAGIDCRYCHISVENSSFAGMPSTKTCMTCHSQLFTDSPLLQPLRESFAKKIPIAWVRAQKLADFAYFNHGIHIQKGVGCSSCHGPIQEMPFVWENKRFLMQECLECHRQPEKYLRPPDEIFNMAWERSRAGEDDHLAEKYRLNKTILMNCSTCHR